MITRCLNFTLCVGLLAFASCSPASLTVVADLGGDSTAGFFDMLNAQGQSAPASPVTPPVPLSIADMLPVSTPELSPGQVVSRPLQLPGLPPVFVVGDDDLSRRWLQQRGPELTRLGATGLVVNVATEEGLRTLKALLPGTEMAPVRGSDLAQRLKLTHYPVLITAEGMAQ
ncbi:integrating conjugative element protein [Salmonella enterica]|uniref:Integrating conjugative element protein n=2 Tax=Salmonella enterica TaxID=28901 RepID=F2Q928_SALET|nr:integrating conjugative element protein [Salmonella enterica]CAX68124.1 putative exported protein [Salmonella enterica subsp. enterica] [Salmonella enterica subsp. enterica serovar Senftenberg]HAB1649563.1 integrating conjugative element protein [Salmonella enterica subsp. enterica]EBY8685101.1 integrating conjugative element protein [Salmonella enterica subsp. enterica serovar Agona]EHW1978143.1 integrating conjugative element protein [Salmonella enterica subsp. enterica serovar Agona]EKG5